MNELKHQKVIIAPTILCLPQLSSLSQDTNISKNNPNSFNYDYL